MCFAIWKANCWYGHLVNTEVSYTGTKRISHWIGCFCIWLGQTKQGRLRDAQCAESDFHPSLTNKLFTKQATQYACRDTNSMPTGLLSIVHLSSIPQLYKAVYRTSGWICQKEHGKSVQLLPGSLRHWMETSFSGSSDPQNCKHAQDNNCRDERSCTTILFLLLWQKPTDENKAWKQYEQWRMENSIYTQYWGKMGMK